MKPYQLAILIILGGVGILSSSASSSSGDDCSDYEFIFARGSGQSLNDVDYVTFKTEVEAALKEENISFYELGENGGYPAFSPGFKEVLGTYLSAGESYKFGESVEKGTEELLSHLKSEIKRCSNKKYILAGYSQGAFVIDKTLPYLTAEKIIYVATFGDPKLYLPEGKNRNACKQIGLSSYRVYVPDCEIDEGIFGGLNPYESQNFDGKRGAWCNQNDFICGSKLNITDLWKGHTNYTGKNGYQKFASIITEKISNSKENSETTARYSEAKKRDIVLINDYSNSPLSSSLKKRLVELANHGSRISVYNLYSFINYSLQCVEMIPFTNDHLEEQLARIDSATFANISDINDNIFLGIRDVARLIKWEPGSERHIFVYSSKNYSNSLSIDTISSKDVLKVLKENDIKLSILSESGLEKDEKYHDLVIESGGQLIGSQYDKIILSQNQTELKPEYFSKTFEVNQNSENSLVIINGALYGITNKKKIVIRNLDKNRVNDIQFIGYDEAGNKVDQKTFQVGQVKTPDTGKAKL